MGDFSEFGDFDGLGLAQLVARKEIKPSELVEESIDRIERLNPVLNFVVTKMYDEAREAAENPPPGPFQGVPFLMKDLQFACAGTRLTHGSRYFMNYVPNYDSEFVRRLRSAGLIIIGKTNTSEFGLAPLTEPQLFGPTRNPWDLDMSPGGSSGGSAAAVAAQVTPLASASDGGGSLRVPAACCGLFGLKPTRGRNPVGPARLESWFGASVGHVVSRTVRDTAAVLDCTAGPEAGAVYVVSPPQRPFLEEVTAPPRNLRIAASSQPLFGTKSDQECFAALERTTRLLEELGHIVEEKFPPLDYGLLTKAYILAIAAEIYADISVSEKLTGRKAVPADFERETWLLNIFGKECTAEKYIAALRVLRSAGQVLAEFFQRYDMFLTPTSGSPGLPVGTSNLWREELEKREAFFEVRPSNSDDMTEWSDPLRYIVGKALDEIPYTPLANITGCPAMTIPLETTSTGMPLGVHFMARFGEEAALFRLAGQLETSKPWSGRIPSICA